MRVNRTHVRSNMRSIEQTFDVAEGNDPLLPRATITPEVPPWHHKGTGSARLYGATHAGITLPKAPRWLPRAPMHAQTPRFRALWATLRIYLGGVCMYAAW